MALAGTHLRLAADLEASCDVLNRIKFFSGNLYPDSRYYTHLDRSITHNKDFVSADFILGNDFRKGWALHLLCDRLQRNEFSKIFPHFLPDEQILPGSDHWVVLTALKVAQDIYDTEQFPICDYLHLLVDDEAPNGEQPQDILDYYSFFREGYLAPNDVDSRATIFQHVGIEPDLLKKIIDRSKAMGEDDFIQSHIDKIYPEMLKAATVFLSENLIMKSS